MNGLANANAFAPAFSKANAKREAAAFRENFAERHL
jgi:hypothetical protein